MEKGNLGNKAEIQGCFHHRKMSGVDVAHWEEQALDSVVHNSCTRQCLKLWTNTVTLILQLNFFPSRLKYMEKSQICDLLSSLLFRNKRVSSCHIAAFLTNINEEMTKLFCFSP